MGNNGRKCNALLFEIKTMFISEVLRKIDGPYSLVPQILVSPILKATPAKP